MPELGIMRVQRCCAATVLERARHRVRVECEIASRHANDHGQRMHAALDILEAALPTADPAETYSVTHKAVCHPDLSVRVLVSPNGYGTGLYYRNGSIVDAMTQIADRVAEPSPWSPRETELLTVTLQLLRQHGYDRLTVDAVAATARASKATVYRRWPSKAELVLAAFIEGIRHVAVPPDTGTLRGDLLRLGEVIRQQARQHASTIRAVLVEVSRNPALNDAMQHQFVDQRKALIRHVLQRAVDRGEIDAAAISDELWDLLPGYLIFRSIIPGRPSTRRTVHVLVDNVIIPSLTRPTG
jgi:AcrR family transcriptional regulator